jgi:hypothetical protein
MFRAASLAKRALGLAIAATLAATGIVVSAGDSQAAASSTKVTASPLTGAALTATTLVLTGTKFKTGTVKNVGSIAFQTSACTLAPALGAELVSALTITSATKLVVRTPSDLGIGLLYLCLYDGQLTALLGQATFTMYGAPDVTSISPAAGTVVGGATVTIVGVGFTIKATATIGGVAMTGVKFINSTTISGVVPPHTSGVPDASVVVKTEGGPSPMASTPITYHYSNAIVLVGDTTGPSTATTTLDITGIGFDSLNFAGTATVVLVQGVYDGNNGVACTNIVEVNDKEIVCDTPTSGLVDGAYTVTVADLAAATPFLTVISSSATFTVAEF